MSICGKEVTEVAQPHPHQQLAGDYNYETGVYTFSMGGKSGWCQQTNLKWPREGFIKKKKVVKFHNWVGAQDKILTISQLFNFLAYMIWIIQICKENSMR